MVFFSHVTRGRWYFCLCILCFLSGWPVAHAAPVAVVESPVTYPLAEEVRYRIYWNGVRLGKLWFHWQESADNYTAQIRIKTSGVTRVFSKQHRTAKVSGLIRRQSGMTFYVPQHYEYTAERKKKNREIVIAYDATGVVEALSVTPPDNPDIRQPVSETGRNAAYDPLTALRAITQYAYNLSQGGRDSGSSFMVFDGRRLTRIIAVTQPEGHHCGDGCVRASGRRELVEGYTEKEHMEFKEADTLSVAIDMMPASSRFPQRISTVTPFGTIYAKRY